MTRDADVHLFRWLMVFAAGAAALITAVAVCLGRMGAPRHLLNMVSDACLTAAHVASEGVSILLAAVVVSTVVGGSASAFLMSVRTRSFLRSMILVRDHPPRLRDAQQRSGIENVKLVRDERMLAFTSGRVRPTAYVSTTAVESLDDDELAAVLAHEAHHALRGDPWRLYATRVLSRTFFWLPIIRDLGLRYELAAEVAADRFAIATTGSRASLARALLRFAGSAPDIAVAHVAGGGASGDRIRLLCENRAAPRTFSMRSAAVSVITSGVLAALLLVHLSLPSM